MELAALSGHQLNAAIPAVAFGTGQVRLQDQVFRCKVQTGVLSAPSYYLFEKQAVPNGVGGYNWIWKRRLQFLGAPSALAN
jgi:hypothetical protein